uniref:Uncharacterized protein n=1 Tax=Oryza glumipatula TaxID=40148 RepID=A0A0D9ZBV2_9ORYZ
MGAAEETTMRLLCSHGGRLVPCGPGGGLRAQELAAGGGHSRQCFDDRRRLQSCCWCCHRRRDQCAAVPQPARPVRQLPAAMSKNVNGARQAAPAVSAAAKATGPVVFELENRRACWEFE